METSTSVLLLLSNVITSSHYYGNEDRLLTLLRRTHSFATISIILISEEVNCTQVRKQGNFTNS
jgi:hypothetical protein